MTLIETAIVAMTISMSFLAIMSLASLSNRVQQQSNLGMTLSMVRWNLSMAVQTTRSWSATMNDSVNESMDCLRNNTPCTTGTNPIKNIYSLESASTPMYSPGPPGKPGEVKPGFTANGSPCNSFIMPDPKNPSASRGNPQCPIRYELSWTSLCAGACVNPPIIVTAKLLYNPGSKEQATINPQNYEFQVNRSSAASTHAYTVPITTLVQYHDGCNENCGFARTNSTIDCMAACNRYCSGGCGPGGTSCSAVLPGLGFSGGTIAECGNSSAMCVCIE